jgi:mutator protein MutT
MTIVVAAGVVEDDGRFLVTRRQAGAHLEGYWEFPGGKCEAGETPRLCLAREIREETGLDIHVGPIVEVLDRIRLDADGRARYHYVLVDYLCQTRGGTMASASDADAAVWAALDELAQYGVAEQTTAVIRKAFALTRRAT